MVSLCLLPLGNLQFKCYILVDFPTSCTIREGQRDILNNKNTSFKSMPGGQFAWENRGGGKDIFQRTDIKIEGMPRNV